MISTRVNVGLLGGAFDTGNRGVSALGLSFCHGLSKLPASYSVTIFDHERNEGRSISEVNGLDVRYRGCYRSNRFYRSGSQLQMQMAAASGLSWLQPTLRHIRSLRAVLDVSGGDSFSDIYGAYRFRSIVDSKKLVVQAGTPLILLPQTYGPFASKDARAEAESIVRQAAAVWARDERSLEIAHDLLGSDFDPSRHASAVDMAFGLPITPPTDAEIRETVENFVSSGHLIVGLNVSGLIYDMKSGGIEELGFRDDYRAIIQGLLAGLLADEAIRVILIGHVFPLTSQAKSSGFDNDAHAMDLLIGSLRLDHSERILPVTSGLNASELKWVIGKCEWFCGTRMHACIGAISQGVPAAAIAYSDKTIGVFETAGVGDCVIDPRVLNKGETIEAILEAFQNRADARERLSERLPSLHEQLDQFFCTLNGQILCD